MPVRIFGVPAATWVKYLPNKSLQHYCYIILLAKHSLYKPPYFYNYNVYIYCYRAYSYSAGKEIPFCYVAWELTNIHHERLPFYSIINPFHISINYFGEITLLLFQYLHLSLWKVMSHDIFKQKYSCTSSIFCLCCMFCPFRPFLFNNITWKVRILKGAHSSLVGWGTSWKVAGSIPDEVTEFFTWPNPSSCITDLGLTQSLT
jgi:hypothetical protein